MKPFDNFFKKIFEKSIDKNVQGPLFPLGFRKKGKGYTDTMEKEMIKKYASTTNPNNFMDKVNEMKKKNPETWGK